MKKIVLTPILHTDSYTNSISGVFRDYFREVLIDPVSELIEGYGVSIKLQDDDTHKRRRGWNAATENPLVLALRSGDVWYSDGKFTGKFNAAISKELYSIGARASVRGEGGFLLEQSKMPISVRMAVYDAKDRSENMHKEAIALLLLMRQSVDIADTGIDVSTAGEAINTDVKRVFSETLAESGARAGGVYLGKEEALLSDLNESSSVAAREVMRMKIDAAVEAIQIGMATGSRVDVLKKTIQDLDKSLASISTNLAEQVAATIVTAKRRELAESIGSNQYIWKTMLDARVRHDHAQLEGTIQSWDIRPVTNTSTGARNHPGEDYNCRCSCGMVVYVPES